MKVKIALTRHNSRPFHLTRLAVHVLSIVLISSCHPDSQFDLEVSIPEFTLPDVTLNQNDNDIYTTDWTSVSITEIVMGFGSGRDGYDTIEVMSAGEISVTSKYDDQTGKSKRFTSDNQKDVGNSILGSQELRNCLRLNKNYIADASGGTQGFLYVFSKNESRKYYFSNYFPDEFRALWKSVVAKIEGIPANQFEIASEVDPFDVNRRAKSRMIESGDSR